MGLPHVARLFFKSVNREAKIKRKYIVHLVVKIIVKSTNTQISNNMDTDKTTIDNNVNDVENQEQNNQFAPYPNLRQSWVIFGFFLLFSLGVSLLIYPLSLIEFDSINEWVNLLSYVVSFVLLFYYIKFKMRNMGQSINLDFKKAPILVFFLLLPIAPLLIIVLEPITSGIPTPEFFEELLKDMVKVSPASFLSVVIAAPLCEEIICRGIILKGLLNNKMNPTNAIMCSSLIFATLHLNLTQGVNAFFIGCFMGWMYYKTRSLWVPIFIHFLNNGLAFLLLFLSSNPDLTTEELVGANNYTTIYYATFILLGLLIYALYRYFVSCKVLDVKR